MNPITTLPRRVSLFGKLALLSFALVTGSIKPSLAQEQDGSSQPTEQEDAAALSLPSKPVEPARPSASAAPASSASASPARTSSSGSGLGPAPASVRRESPRETVIGFLDAAGQEDFQTAAHYLYLRNLTPQQQKLRGPVLARKLAEVLEQTVWFDMESISEDPNAGAASDKAVPKDLKVATIEVPGGSQGIRLSREKDPRTGEYEWLFSPRTVEAVDKLNELYGLPDTVEALPQWMRTYRLWGLRLWQWLGLALVALGAWGLGIVLERPTVWAIKRFAKQRGTQKPDEFAKVAQGPGRLLVTLSVFLLSFPYLKLSLSVSQSIERCVYVGMIYVGMKVAIRFVALGAEAILEHGSHDAEDTLRLRELATRLGAIKRIAMVIVVVIAFALALVQFPEARAVGLSLLGSAGIAAGILGFAAQKTFANLFAGILIALTQPMRIGDVVIVEGEWGKIEEIGATHVVVQIWDLRRLVLPVTYFLDQPFQNWTKNSAEVWGTVQIAADYSVTVEEMRAEFDRVVEGDPLWNGKSKSLIVLDVTERATLFRATVSADDADKLWDLRCKVREKLLAYLQQDARRMPRLRTLASPDADEKNPSAVA